MTKQEFIEHIELRYEKTGDIDFLNDGEDEEILIPSLGVKITFNEDDTFNIYRDFCYPIRECEENFENEYRTVLQETTVSLLESHFGVQPCVEDECGYGCPFDDSLVGYWNKPFNVDFVISFVEVCMKSEAKDIGNAVSKLIMESVSEQAEKYELVELDDDSYINNQKNLIVFAKDIVSFNHKKIDISSLEQINYPVSATRYFCGRMQSGKIIAVDMKSIVMFFKLCDHFHIDKSDFDFYSDGKECLYIKGKLKAIISIETNANEIVDEEYSLFIRKLDALKKIKPQVNSATLDFSHLTYEDFERLCYDILIKRGFIDVHPVGKSNASDGGKDILASEEYRTITGIETRKWIWQCKHSKKSLNRKDVSEINDLLQENNASAYGLLCSSSLTPDLINRLELKKSAEVRIVYYGTTELNTLLSQHPDLLAKYKLLGGADR